MTTMRYLHAGKTIRFLANALRSKQVNVDEMSDYMQRDIGLVDGRPAVYGDFAENDSRSRRLDLLTLTPYAS
jgi:hypothetical protein